jgi:mono/diheme cytochrome c family protein
MKIKTAGTVKKNKSIFNFAPYIFIAFACLFFLSPNLFMPKTAYSYNNSQGKYLFHYYNCDDCHSVNGVGGSLGPSLSNYGNMVPDFNWTVQQIKHPNSHFKRGDKISIQGKTYYVIMPSYNYIPQYEVNELASYLESLKK